MAASNRWAVALLTRLVGAWRSLVARLPWAQEAPGSNPGAPTNILNSLVNIGLALKSTTWYQLRQQFIYNHAVRLDFFFAHCLRVDIQRG